MGKVKRDISSEVEFYFQRLKEAKAKLYAASERDRRAKEGMPSVISQEIAEGWSAYHGDCIPIIKGIPDGSIGFSIFSPPFSSLFVYTDMMEDMGNSMDDDFYDHFSYLVPELYRVMRPGRIISIHCMLLPSTIVRDGVVGIKDFRGALIRLFTKNGFIHHSEVGIWKDPLIQATRTKMISLSHKQVVKDSCRSGHAFLDFLENFRKPGENLEPVSHGRGFEEYIGGAEIEKDKKKHEDPSLNRYSQRVWQRYADPVWFDIRQTNTLNVRLAREKDDERHICPLQLDVIARCLELWSNKGDVVLSPFAGIGSEGYQSLLMERKFIGIELKASYYNVMLRNLRAASGKRMKGFVK